VHDWHWLLSKAGLLAHCGALAGVLHLAASAVVVAAWLRAARAAFAPGAAGEPAPRLL
jgi:hypothetical protein